MRPLHQLEQELPHWQKTADLVDQCIDLALNLSQSAFTGFCPFEYVLNKVGYRSDAAHG